MATTTKQDRVRELQRALYRAAKADPERRFHALYDKVHAGTSWSGRGGRAPRPERAWRG
jgi:DNA-binding protein H-NS